MSFRFSPPWWACVLTVAVVATFTVFGLWQWDRGHSKAKRLQSAQASQMAAPAKPAILLAGDNTNPLWLTVHGRFVGQQGYLQENQSYKQQPGVHAVYVFVTDAGQSILVNAGWAPLNNGQAPKQSFALEPEQSLQGYWRALPKAGMLLQTPAKECIKENAKTLNYPQLLQLRCLFGNNLVDGMLELNTPILAEYATDWRSDVQSYMPPERHYGYAFQWWAMALTVFILFIFLNVKNKNDF